MIDLYSFSTNNARRVNIVLAAKRAQVPYAHGEHLQGRVAGTVDRGLWRPRASLALDRDDGETPRSQTRHEAGKLTEAAPRVEGGRSTG
jgi:hypothetical protein